MEDEDELVPENLQRTVSLEHARGHVNMDTGEFPAVLATEGEASDGHILSIRGGKLASEMPMLFRHHSSIDIPGLGMITQPKKRSGNGGMPELAIVGKFDLGSGGEGDPFVGIRRGIAHMVNTGTLPAMSIRWDEVPGKAKRRINLPSNHPAFLDSEKCGRDHPGFWGWYFEEWVGREGSVVAIGADPSALIGRSEETDDELEHVFWVAMARSVESSSDGMGQLVEGFAAIRGEVAKLRENGCGDADLVNAMGALAGLGPTDLVPFEYGDGHTIHLPRQAWKQLRSESSREYLAGVAVRGLGPAGEGAPTPEPRDDVTPATPRELSRKTNTVGALSAEDLFGQVGSRLSDAVGKASKRVAGRL